MTDYEFKLPDIGEGLSEGEIVRWHVAIGDTVKVDQDLVDIETDKAVVEIPAPVGGVVKALAGEPGDIIKVGGVLAVIEAESEAKAATPAKKKPSAAKSPEAAPALPAVAPAPSKSKGNGRAKRVLASPATRKLALERGVDLTALTGTGSGGRVSREDVERAAQGGGAPAPAAAKPAVVARPEGKDEVVRLRGLRRQTAKSMTESWQHIPHVFDFKELDAGQLIRARESLHAEYEESGVKLTYLPFFIKAAASALGRHPNFNASINMEREELIYHHRCNIGFATATPDGLIVPVIHDADTKSLPELAREIETLSQAARARTASVEQLSNGTFTISNYGSYGAWLGTPLIRPPEVAIAGFGRIQDAVVARDGQPAVRSILPMVIAMDHRVNDGEQLGAFIATLTAYLSDPIRLLAAP